MMVPAHEAGTELRALERPGTRRAVPTGLGHFISGRCRPIYGEAIDINRSEPRYSLRFLELPDGVPRSEQNVGIR